MKTIIIIAILSLAISLNSCSQEQEIFSPNIEYPYAASLQRQNVILDNMNNLKLGISNKEVLELLTLPDEINATYPSNVTAKDTVGFSYVYLIERKYLYDKRVDMSEKLIRIHFDEKGILINAYAIGISKFNGIEAVVANTDNKLPGSIATIEEAIKRSMIIPISDPQEIRYKEPIIVKCIAVEDPVEPGQIVITTCYYYQKFNVTETISGEIDNIIEGEYTTYNPESEDKIVINSSHILILQESKVEGKYHLIKVLYDAEINRKEINTAIETLAYLKKQGYVGTAVNINGKPVFIYDYALSEAYYLDGLKSWDKKYLNKKILIEGNLIQFIDGKSIIKNWKILGIQNK